MDTHWWWVEGYAQGTTDGKYDLKNCREAYNLLCKFNGEKKRVVTYRAFLRGVRDAISSKIKRPLA